MYICDGGLKKKLDILSGFKRHIHFVGFFNVPVLAPIRGQLFNGFSENEVNYTHISPKICIMLLIKFNTINFNVFVVYVFNVFKIKTNLQ